MKRHNIFIGLLLVFGLFLFGFSNRSEEKNDMPTPTKTQELNDTVEAELVEINNEETKKETFEKVSEDFDTTNEEVREDMEYETIEQPEEGVEVIEIEGELNIDYQDEDLESSDEINELYNTEDSDDSYDGEDDFGVEG